MKEYHKIQTVYLRDPDNHYKTLLEGQFAKPEFEYLKDNIWTFTEKVDGMNIRIIRDNEGTVEFRGKTDKAEIPKWLFQTLGELFGVRSFSRHSLPALCLYGEGYGAKIQKGGESYIPNGQGFILFDVWVDGIWLDRHNVEDIAQKLNIKTVPIIGTGTLLEGIELVRHGFDSQLRNIPPEGIVMRPEVELLNRRSERVITKLKAKDFNL